MGPSWNDLDVADYDLVVQVVSVRRTSKEAAAADSTDDTIDQFSWIAWDQKGPCLPSENPR